MVLKHIRTDALHLVGIPDPRAVEHRKFRRAPADASFKMNHRSATGCVERYHIQWLARAHQCRAAGRKERHMLSRTARGPADFSRRSHAQRRLRRAATHRFFCSTNGCTTFLVPDQEGHTATCPVCGLQRKLRSQPAGKLTVRAH